MGTIDKIYTTANMKVHARYNYSLEGTSYQGSRSVYGYEKIATVNSRFIISVPIGFNSGGVILLNYPVPDSIKEPIQGWKKIPKFK